MSWWISSPSSAQNRMPWCSRATPESTPKGQIQLASSLRAWSMALRTSWRAIHETEPKNGTELDLVRSRPRSEHELS